MKVLQVCRLTPLWGMDLFKEISKSYDDIITIFLSGSAQPELEKLYNGKVIFLELNRHSAFWRIKAFFKLLFLCKKNKFNMVITHHYKPTLIMHWVTLFCSIKKLYSMHHNFGNFRRFSQKIGLFFLKKSWRFITVSNALKKEFIDLGVNSDQVITIHNAIDIQNLNQYPKPIAREKLGLSQDGFIFGTLGRLVPGKNHELLIESFKNINAQLVIIGTGPLEQKLKNLAPKNIHIITDCAHLGANYLKAFDVFVFPSQQEAFGLVLLEAQEAGLPIIASNTGGIPEAAPSAELVPPNDVEALSQALQKALTIPLKPSRNIFPLEDYRKKFQDLLKL